MKNKIITAHLLLLNNDTILDSVKKIFYDNSEDAYFLISKSLKEFERKLNWFSTTFIVISAEALALQAALKLVDKIDVAATPILFTSFPKEELESLPTTLKQNYKKNAGIRVEQKRIRLEKLKKQKISIQKNQGEERLFQSLS